MSLILSLAAGASLGVWVYLLLLRGRFWRAEARLQSAADAPDRWPAVAALVPARDEEEVIGPALLSLLAQDYPGPLRILVVDDHSRDGTADAVRRIARQPAAGERLHLLGARPPEAGWTGKLWALNEGLAEARRRWPEGDYLWLTDADIAHGPATLRRLVAKAEREGLDLVSLMAQLACTGLWARLLIPPFIFFFQKLYPFAWVADPGRSTAAAAGGCVLLRAEAFAAAGDFAAIKGALIDDCALAAAIKAPAVAQGRRGIWLGLADDSRSLRPYRGLKDIWDMVARSAYTQLRRSPPLLAGTLVAMTLTYLVPPLALLAWPWHGNDWAALAGAAAWGLMAVAVQPSLRLYRQPAWLAPLLPLAAFLYTLMTADSAWLHWRGRGGLWKGRAAATALEDRGVGR